MESTETRTCRHCLEGIREGARRCPHCQSWQTRWAADAQNPRFEVAVVVIGVTLLAAVFLGLLIQVDEPEAASGRPARGFEALLVDEVECVPMQNDFYSYVVVTGRITNPTSTEFSAPLLSVTFTDSEGEVIDACAQRDHALIVPANSEARFKVGDRWLARDIIEYAGCEVILTWATARE